MAIYNKDGTPHYLRIYDNPQYTDRYTVVFTGRFAKTRGWYPYLAMSDAPFYPQGFCQHGESQYNQVDRPHGTVSGKHLGKCIPFSALNKDCQRAILQDYRELWRK